MVSPFRELTEAAFWVIEREVAASEALSRRALAVGRPGDSAARPLRGTPRRGRRRRGAIPGILQPARAMPSGGRPRARRWARDRSRSLGARSGYGVGLATFTTR